MHELSLAEGVLGHIDAAAQTHGFSRVRVVWLEIGQLAAVDGEALAFCFAAVARGSRAEGARLEIVTMPGAGWCDACAREVAMSELVAACPRCGACPLPVTAGSEMRVKELDVI